VKIELAVGKVTKVVPWTTPARLTIRFPALDARSSGAVCQWARPCSHRTTAAMVVRLAGSELTLRRSVEQEWMQL
jgi:hypothetical protein